MPDEKSPDQNRGPATPEKMQVAIETSGYLLEGRFARVMAERGFFVEMNRFTPDPADPSKSMEIDVGWKLLRVGK